MSLPRIGFLQRALIFCVVLGEASYSLAGGPHQKGGGKSCETYCNECQHRRHGCLADPPRAPVASAIAAPQTVATQMNVVNPFAASRSDLNPNVLRALADLMEDKSSSASQPQPGVTNSRQKGSASNAAAPTPAGPEQDLESEVQRLKDKLTGLEQSIEKLNESTIRMLKALSNKSE